ncbi:hypothetical protein T02_16204 [Trichinella nativa]|uniref:Uncharacterized protein n=1 Tax=Trichinella nativa TaxID=6335 RepID=A0A0V1LKK4_9BILA|nr:hypothetical protein T02_16204 [Trichinella nativa]
MGHFQAKTSFTLIQRFWSLYDSPGNASLDYAEFSYLYQQQTDMVFEDDSMKIALNNPYTFSKDRDITVNGDWKLEFFTAAIPDPEMLAEDFAICSNISNYNSTLPSENECMLSVLLCLAYNPFSPKKLLKEPYRCSFGEIVIPIKISLIKTDGVVIHRLSSENAIKSEFSTKLPTLVCMFAVDLQIQCNVVSA